MESETTDQKSLGMILGQDQGHLLILNIDSRWSSTVLLSQVFASCLRQGDRESYH